MGDFNQKIKAHAFKSVVIKIFSHCADICLLNLADNRSCFMADALLYMQYACESPAATVRRGRRERKEPRCVMEWLSRHDGNGHGKQIKNDYGRRAEEDKRSIL